MLGAALIHPDHKEVFPFAPEPIRKEDGAKKNDCERNAAKRLLDDFRCEHPHLKTIAVEDALASNGIHIKYLKNKGFRFILGAKPGDHEFLFRKFEVSESRKSWKIRNCSPLIQAPKTQQQFQSQLLRHDASFTFGCGDSNRLLLILSLRLSFSASFVQSGSTAREFMT